MKFTSEAHSLIFYTAESGNEDPVFFTAHEARDDDKDQIAALKSDRAKASGISRPSRPRSRSASRRRRRRSRDPGRPETPETPAE
jgi:hypothetical protein